MQTGDIPRFFPDAKITATSLSYSPYFGSEKYATISFEEVPISLQNVSKAQETTVSPDGVKNKVDVDPNFYGFTTLNEVKELIIMECVIMS